MKFIQITLVALTLAFTHVHAANDKASEQSIREMLQVTQSRKMLDQMYKQIDQMMLVAMKQSLQGQNVTPEIQAQLERIQGKVWKTVQQEASWEKLEPIYIKIYSENFTQEEIDGILAFYKSPIGQSMIKKMPLVLQSSMREMQVFMQPVIKKVSEMLQEEMKALTQDTPNKQGNKK